VAIFSLADCSVSSLRIAFMTRILFSLSTSTPVELYGANTAVDFLARFSYHEGFKTAGVDDLDVST